MEDLDTADSRRLHANRKALETTCVTCGRGFRFGEHVARCNTCGAFQHVACWEGNVCPHPIPPDPAEGPSEPLFVADTSLAPLSPVAGLHETSFRPSALAIPVPAGGEPPLAAPSLPAPVRLNPDERVCPACGETIKSAALRCRFCNTVLDERIKAADIPPAEARTVASNARNALIFGLIGLVICAPVFGSMAISNGNAAIAVLDRYPLHDGPRGKARAGVVLGWAGWTLLVVGFLIKVLNVR
jgi:hypothetical protein